MPRWRRAVLRAVIRLSIWGERNALLVSAIAIGTPFAILQMIAYSRGYTGWISMVSSWFTGG
jgi:hypothetical protein